MKRLARVHAEAHGVAVEWLLVLASRLLDGRLRCGLISSRSSGLAPIAQPPVDNLGQLDREAEVLSRVHARHTFGPARHILDVMARPAYEVMVIVVTLQLIAGSDRPSRIDAAHQIGTLES